MAGDKVDGGFQAAGGLVARMLRLAEASMVAGVCDQHGAAEVLVRDGRAWYCPACLERGKSEELRAQWLAARAADLHQIATIPPRYRGQRFPVSAPAHKRVRAIAAAFRDQVLTSTTPTWGCLTLMGNVGTGKTLLACEFGESAITRLGLSVRYCTAKTMIAEIQASYGREGKSEDGEIARFVQYDLLILDEVDAIPNKDNAALLLTEVVNQRYGALKPLIVITNQALATLGEFVGDRVADRLAENAFVCAFDWPSFRSTT